MTANTELCRDEMGIESPKSWVQFLFVLIFGESAVAKQSPQSWYQGVVD